MGIEFTQAFDPQYITSQFAPLFTQVFQWFPFWGPILLAEIFWHEWMHYVQADWRSNIKWVLLEIQLPKEINKTPLAMEIVLNALNQGGSGTWLDHIWKGRQKDWFSLEMASFEGHVKFFVRTNAGFKNLIEAQLYAQYPDIEVFEVPDYTAYVDYRGKEGEWDAMGIEYAMNKEDPYPLKTYVDYGLDKEGVKEEFKIDPITSVIEYLGTVGPGEQVWVQILVQAAGKRYKKKDGSMGDWRDEAKDVVKEITTKKEKKVDKDGKEKEVTVSRLLEMTESEREAIKAIERNLTKVGFDCGIRAMYVVKKGKFNPSHIKAFGAMLRAYSSSNLNGFKPDSFSAGFDFPWQDWNDIRLTKLREEQFKAYKYRSWFYPPRKRKPYVLTSEELATIFHFPGGVAQTPTFGRIPSRKGEAPVNLPI